MGPMMLQGLSTPSEQTGGRGIDTDSFVATYYNGPDLTYPFLAQSYTEPIDFLLECWGEPYPYSGCKLISELTDGREYSVRWTGRIWAPEDGDYTFTLANVDDGSRIILDDVEVVDWSWRYPYADLHPSPQTVTLATGWHHFIIDYEQRLYWVASLQIRWAGPDFADEVIPLAASVPPDGVLFPPAEGICESTYPGTFLTEGSPINTLSGGYDYTGGPSIRDLGRTTCLPALLFLTGDGPVHKPTGLRLDA
jgi:hypothetical protein